MLLIHAEMFPSKLRKNVNTANEWSQVAQGKGLEHTGDKLALNKRREGERERKRLEHVL